MTDSETQNLDPTQNRLRIDVSEDLVQYFPESKRLCEFYWERESSPKGHLRFTYRVSDLAAIGGLSSGEVSRLARSISRVFIEGLMCPSCGREREAYNRTGYQEQIKAHFSEEVCRSCAERYPSTDRGEGQPSYTPQEIRELGERARQVKEREREAYIIKDEREREMRALEQRKRSAISGGWFSRDWLLPPLEELELKHAVALLALGRACASEDFSSFRPLTSVPERLTPTREYDQSLLVELNHKGVIVVDSDASSLETFNFEQDAEGNLSIESYYPTNATWRLPMHSMFKEKDVLLHKRTVPLEQFKELNELFDHTSSWPSLWAVAWEGNDWRVLWKEISLYECLAYLRFVLNEHSLPFKIGDKTRFVLNDVLESFSVAQVWNMIWRAGRDAAAFYMRQSVTRPHAANTVVGSIQRQAERALAENWQLKGFRRNPQLPRSVLSEVFFGKALRIGDGGFTVVIPPEGTSLENLPPRLSGQA